MDPSLRHKSIRLSPEHYIGCRWYFVTICSPDPRAPFNPNRMPSGSLDFYIKRVTRILSRFPPTVSCPTISISCFMVFR